MQGKSNASEGSSLKYRALIGVNLLQKKFTSITHADAVVDGFAVASNGIFTAWPKKVGSAGAIVVVKSYDFQQIDADTHQINAHKSKIKDL